jgi:putative alkyl quinolone biosynthesis protein PqsB
MRILSSAVNQPVHSDLAIDTLLPAVHQALAQAGLQAAEIDMIVTISVSPDHLAIDPAIIGPRIGHPLQMRLAAERAYVFDLMDASVAKALHVADIFGFRQGYRRVLFARAECGHGVRADTASGFAVADGAMAMVCEPTGNSRFHSGRIEGIAPLMLMLNDAIKSPADKKAFARFAPPADIAQRYSDAAREGVAALNGEAFDRARYLVEHWDFGAGRSLSGPFDTGLGLAGMLADGRHGDVTLLSFDPFGPAADAVTVCYGRSA